MSSCSKVKIERERGRERRLSIGWKRGEIKSTNGKIWEATAYECIERGETPGDGLEIWKGRFHHVRFCMLMRKVSNFARDSTLERGSIYHSEHGF